MPIAVSAVTGLGGPHGRRESRRFVVGVVGVCCCLAGVVMLTGCGGSSRHAGSASVHPGAVVGQKATLTLGEEGTAVGLDDEEPDEEFETGVEGEKPPPTDKPYRPTEAETAAAPRTASGSRDRRGERVRRSSGLSRRRRNGSIAVPRADRCQ